MAGTEGSGTATQPPCPPCDSVGLLNWALAYSKADVHHPIQRIPTIPSHLVLHVHPALTILRTHLLQMEQWCASGGLGRSQVVHQRQCGAMAIRSSCHASTHALQGSVTGGAPAPVRGHGHTQLLCMHAHPLLQGPNQLTDTTLAHSHACAPIRARVCPTAPQVTVPPATPASCTYSERRHASHLCIHVEHRAQ